METRTKIKPIEIEKILKALADGNRLRIMNLLMRGELCVCELEEILGLSQTNVSRHLNKLTQAGLLDSRKEAQWVFYSINNDFISGHSILAKYLETSFERNEACRLDVGQLLRVQKEGASGISKQCRQV
jgi:ArsR family transcriptional regulator